MIQNICCFIHRLISGQRCVTETKIAIKAAPRRASVQRGCPDESRQCGSLRRDRTEVK
ncbi:hypothetical protein PAXRUDRAFT_821883 [Paxillus rubicundulus Ve08.2h10]|uniref:Uncharacterized protein n=1 Tax=Paxillus rubicundulus Ve08.2h10 TaxID=930991 RepID=A0A0D0EAE0_9AGAM|nr:hypothetical protein PAXRUDRAFT_821883 [Paxillus rubicundulus Ve08.2h10]